MDNITIGQGATIRDTITVDEEGAVSATFVAFDGDNVVIEQTFNFVGMVAEVTVFNTDIEPDTYDYYYSVTWDDGSVDYLPDLSSCEGNCEFPKLIICGVPGGS